jgi:hypothetical protein
MVGVDLTALSVMGGAIGVGLGFGMQKIASNYVSGFLVLIERRCASATTCAWTASRAASPTSARAIP